MCFFCQDEITEMKRKLKIMNHQIDQLKEEITTKEAALVKVNLDHTRVEKEKEALKVNIFFAHTSLVFITFALSLLKTTLSQQVLIRMLWVYYIFKESALGF